MSERWQDTVKPGDKLLRWGRGDDMIVTVTRVSEASIWYGNGNHEWRANRRTARETGGSTWHFSHVRPATDEDAKKIRDKNAKYWARYECAGKVYALSPDQIRQVRAFVESFAGGEA